MGGLVMVIGGESWVSNGESGYGSCASFWGWFSGEWVVVVITCGGGSGLVVLRVDDNGGV